MSQREWLVQRGWRKFGEYKYGYTTVYLWDHPNHQHNRHGGFSTGDAVLHQKQADKVGCDCIKGTR